TRRQSHRHYLHHLLIESSVPLKKVQSRRSLCGTQICCSQLPDHLAFCIRNLRLRELDFSSRHLYPLQPFATKLEWLGKRYRESLFTFVSEERICRYRQIQRWIRPKLRLFQASLCLPKLFARRLETFVLCQRSLRELIERDSRCSLQHEKKNKCHKPSSPEMDRRSRSIFRRRI